MSYRVEQAKSGRAVCRDTVCKNEGVKIEKGELRLGTWVAFEDRGSWTWKHWGCVSGKQLQNMRQQLSTGPNEYDFDMLDGYDDDDPSGLKSHPDLQEKVRRVITQGFIDPEDWNGDPEMNVLGQTGTRSAASKRAIAKEKKERKEELEATERSGSAEVEDAAVATPTPAEKRKSVSKKRAKEESDVEDEKQAKKKRGKKVKKQEESDEELMPAKKSRVRTVKKKEPNIKNEDEPMLEVDDAPIAKEEPVDEPIKLPAPVKKPRVRKGAKNSVKEEVSPEPSNIAEPIANTAPSKKARSRKGAKKVAEDEKVSEDAAGNPESNNSEKTSSVKLNTTKESPPAKKIRGKKGGAKKAVKNEEPIEASDTAGEDEQQSVVNVSQAVKKSRAKKGSKKVAKDQIAEEHPHNSDATDDVAPDQRKHNELTMEQVAKPMPKGAAPTKKPRAKKGGKKDVAEEVVEGNDADEGSGNERVSIESKKARKSKREKSS